MRRCDPAVAHLFPGLLLHASIQSFFFKIIIIPTLGSVGACMRSEDMGIFPFVIFFLSLSLYTCHGSRGIDQMTGNGFIICFALSQSLAKHEEADAALSKHGNKCSYETRCRTAATRISSAVKVRKR